MITQAERQAKQAEHPATEGSLPARKGVGAIHHCFRHFFGKCGLQDKGRRCSFHHVCPFCAKPTEGCLDNHLRPRGLTTIRIKDKRALEDGQGGPASLSLTEPIAGPVSKGAEVTTLTVPSRREPWPGGHGQGIEGWAHTRSH